MNKKFPRKLYKCNRCRDTQVAWWPFARDTGGTKWLLIPATINAAEGEEKGWKNEEGSVVWCNPDQAHECKAPEPTPRPEQVGSGYEPLPVPGTVPDSEEKEPEGEEKGIPGQPNNGQGFEDDPLKPLVDTITKRVLKKVEPEINQAQQTSDRAEKAAKDALEKAKEAKPGKGGPDITVVQWVPEPPTPSRDLGVQHKEFPRLLFWIQMGEPVFLSGPPGGGKTEAFRMVAEALGREFGTISLNPGTPESRLIGHPLAGGGFHQSLYRKLYEGGGVFCIDEMDNASAAMLTTINGHTNGYGAFPDGLVARHKDFVLGATGNTVGRGGTMNHAERRALDAATLDRFVLLDWPYDEGLEEAMVRAVLADDEKRTKWLGWVRSVREFCAVNHPRIVVSPRAATKGAKAIVHDKKLKLRVVVDEVLFKGVEVATVKAILAAKPLPTL